MRRNGPIQYRSINGHMVLTTTVEGMDEPFNVVIGPSVTPDGEDVRGHLGPHHRAAMHEFFDRVIEDLRA